MSKVTANIQNELQKLMARKFHFFGLILTGVTPLILGLIVKYMGETTGIIAADALGFPLLILGLFTSLFIPLFTFAASTDAYAGERGDKTLQLVLTKPISRFKVFLSKVAAIGLIIFIHLIILGLSSTLSALFFMEGNAASNIFDILIAYGVSFLPLAVLGLLAVLTAQGFKSSSGALLLCFFLYILMKGLVFIFPAQAILIPTYYTSWYEQWINGAISFNLLQSLIYLLSTSTFLFSLGYYFFSKKEL